MNEAPDSATGDFIAEQIDSVDLRDGFTRQLILRVFQLRNDWVIQIRFQSEHPFERSLHLLEQMDFLKDIENHLLFVFHTGQLLVQPAPDVDGSSSKLQKHYQRLDKVVKGCIESFLILVEQRARDLHSSPNVDAAQTPQCQRLQGMT